MRLAAPVLHEVWRGKAHAAGLCTLDRGLWCPPAKLLRVSINGGDAGGSEGRAVPLSAHVVITRRVAVFQRAGFAIAMTR
jgi:hypothetical protein